MNVMPELLQMSDGTPVDAARWPLRRREIYEAIIPHQYGGMPPAPKDTRVIQRAQHELRHWKGVVYRTYELRTRFDDGREISMTLSLWIPPGDGPFPVLLDCDGCWRTFTDQVIQHVIARGNIAASFDRTQAAADNKDAYRDTGVYRLFPDAQFAVLSAWAWGVHRCIDALVTMKQVRPDAIAITGHSRGGKTVLLAGATDERIAITNPNNSGIGGAALHRLKGQRSEVIDSFYHSGNIFWFGQGLKDHRYRDAELPYDQHFMQALVAPRPLLLTEAYEDFGANPAGAYAAAQSARRVYELLGRPDAIGWAYRECGHDHTLTDYEALLDFMDVHLHGRPARRNFQRALYPELESLLAPPKGA